MVGIMKNAAPTAVAEIDRPVIGANVATATLANVTALRASLGPLG